MLSRLGKGATNQYPMLLWRAALPRDNVTTTSKLHCSLVILATLVLGAPTASAQGGGRADRQSAERPTSTKNSWWLCGPMELAGHPVTATTTTPGQRQGAPTQLFADQLESGASQSRLSGNASVQRADQRIEGNELLYDRDTSEVTSTTPLRYSASGVTFQAASAQVNLDKDTGLLAGAEYALGDQHARGGARQIRLDGPDVTRMSNFTYTTCNPGDAAWLFRGGEIVLDRKQGFGTAYHTRLELFGVPVLYLPVISFPISDQRKSGFLMPSLELSTERGTEIVAPYYVNLAPNYDLTVTPDLMSKRGALLGLDYRYLTHSSKGELNLDYMPYDRKFDDQRYLLSYTHDGTWRAGWSTNIAAQYASDQYYFRDLSDTLSVASTTFLEQRADLNYVGGPWAFRARVQGFQTMDPTITPANRPYRRLPQLTLGLRQPLAYGRLRVNLATEWVRFDQDLKVHGDRFDIQPSVSMPWQRTWGYVTPTLSARYTAYHLQNTAPGQPDNPQRSVPTFSLDSGLYFERTTHWGDKAFTQTLEPRLYYLRTPYRDQSALPVFDTTEPEFTFASLFRDNRFIGADRVGDANQLTVALTSRLLGRATGTEWLRGSVGQIHYFSDRRVQLPGQPVATGAESDLVGELAAHPGKDWTTQLDMLWDPYTRASTRRDLRVQYQPAADKILNLSYRFQKDTLEQADVSAYWPIGRRWHVMGRWDHSLLDHRDLEAFLGVEYESCCWALRVVDRYYVNTTDSRYNRALMVEMVLKGLTGLGSSIESVLEHGILGYSEQR